MGRDGDSGVPAWGGLMVGIQPGPISAGGKKVSVWQHQIDWNTGIIINLYISYILFYYLRLVRSLFPAVQKKCNFDPKSPAQERRSEEQRKDVSKLICYYY